MITFELITGGPRIEEVRAMFREYQASIGVDLCFQGFEAELAALPGDYAPPLGRLWLADVDGECGGCIGLRPLKGGRPGHDCEMKRLYVRDKFRGLKLGRMLAERVLQDAREIGYGRMVLDTMETMTAAQALYRSLGFVDIAPYYMNPLPGISYLALDFKA